MLAALVALLCRAMRTAIVPVVALVLVAGWASPAPAATTEPPPPEKIGQLVDILSDPEVKAWLEQRRANTPPPDAPSAAEAAPPILSMVLGSIKGHIQNMVAAVPRLPAQFDRAWNILMVEFEDSGLLLMLALIVGFIAAGLGLDKLTRWLLRCYLQWMKTIPWDEPFNRLKGLAARSFYALAMIVAFTLGSAGMFLVFDWPPLLREIVLAYLTVAIVTRTVLMLSRLVLLPPSLGLPNSQQYRVLPVSDESAEHWYKYASLNTAWFAFVGATLGLLTTFGFDEAGRLAVGVVAGLIQLVLVLTAIWRRPTTAGDAGQWLQPRSLSWLLTAFFVALWLLRISGATTAFWFVFAVVALPAVIAAAKSAVHYVLRPPEEGSNGAPVAPVTITVIDRGIRVALILTAAYFLARVWGLDVAGVAQGDSAGERLLRGGLNAAIIILAADFGWSVAKALISRKLGGESASTGHASPVTPQLARMRTLLPIFQNILFAVIVVMAILMTLSSLGVEIAPLIAGAGVVGVAIGFGAQTMVKDVISGMFYLLDDAFRVGEYIESGSHKGTVESFSLRSVKLRHHRGYLTTVPFGELGAVQNMSRDWVIDKFNIVVGYDTDIEKVRKLIKKLGQELAADPEFAPHTIEPLKMQGVQAYGDYGIQIRLKLMTKPGEQFPIRRKALVMLTKIFAANGIEIPFPTVQIKAQQPDQAGSAEAVAAAATAIRPKAVPE